MRTWIGWLANAAARNMTRMSSVFTKRKSINGEAHNALQWLNPHNWYLMMFSPSTIHVLPFDPQHGSDNARVYAGKYASKPEKD